VVVGEGGLVVLAAGRAVPGATLDAAKLFDVDVDQLAGSLALKALGRLEPQTPELAHPNSGQDPRNGRQRHSEHLGDLRARKAQPTQRSDRLHAPLAGSISDRGRRRGTMLQPQLAVGAIAPHPLARASDADFGGRGRLRHRPRLLNDTAAQHPPLVQAESRVTVQLHPVSSLELVASSTTQPPRRPG
jgi:hypothetical protein